MKKYLVYGSGLIVALAVLVGGYYALSPLWRVVEVHDALPEAFVNPLEEGGQVYAMHGPFDVHGTVGHPAEGVVSVFEGDGKRFIRFEDFKTINGPQLHLYLAKDVDAKEFIDLGPIRGTEGDINYELPDDVILDDYPYVMHWCVPFGVLFNYARIESEL